MIIEIRVTGVDHLAGELRSLNSALVEQQSVLFRSLGDAYVSDIKQRIITGDGGAWAPLSKWGRAKTGQSKALLHAEKFVRAKVTETMLQVGGKGGKWTFTQHHEGFENQKEDPSEEHDEHGRVVLKIRDAEPLAIYQEFRNRRDATKTKIATVFAFVAKRAGQTPARKIWPNQSEAEAIAMPIASRWLKKVITETMGESRD